jgi:hypothetical protein
MKNHPNSSPIDALVDLACRDGVDVRPTLLRVLTDLYVQKPVHSADEVTQYLELALGLIDAVDEPTRAAVANSLSTYPAAPAAILERLGVTAAAAPTPRAPASADLCASFFAAGPQERRLILLNLEPGAAAQASSPANSEIARLLENAALARNTGEFSRTLERALAIGPELALRIARDPSGEPIVVAARALGMKAAVLQRVLLFLDPAIGQSVQRVYDLAQLFDELPRASAERMLEIWRNGSAPERTRQKPAYESVYGADGARDHRSLSTRRAAPLPGRQSERTRGAR